MGVRLKKYGCIETIEHWAMLSAAADAVRNNSARGLPGCNCTNAKCLYFKHV